MERQAEIKTLEKRLDALVIVRQTSTYKGFIIEVTKEFNRANLEYARLTGKEYVPK